MYFLEGALEGREKKKLTSFHWLTPLMLMTLDIGPG